LWETHDHDIKQNEDPTLGPVCLGICRNVVDEEARADEEDDFEEILAVKGQRSVLNEATFLVSKSMDMGLFSHKPKRVTNGIQESKIWMLKSIARALARRSGGCGTEKKRRRKERRKYTMATAPSAEKDTIGRRTMPNHLLYDTGVNGADREHACKDMRAGRESAYSSLICDSLWTKFMLSTSYGER
jgi:hypothetical protein